MATTERYITPSKITAWLDCAHYLTLKHQVEDGIRAAAPTGTSSFAQLLMDKGLQHEAQCLADLKAQGLRVHEVPDRERRESFTAWAARVGDPFAIDCDVLFQVPLLHDGIRGIADFLLRVDLPDGTTVWEPLDAKLARTHAKPGHVLQLCFYADAIAARTGTAPSRMHLWLGSGRREELLVADFTPYWRRLRSQLQPLLDGRPASSDTRPEPCDHCGFCEFATTCDQQWRDEDSLIYVAGLRSGDRAKVEAAGVTTLSDLATAAGPVAGLADDRLERVRTQAALQLALRPDDGVKTPDSTPIAPCDGEPVWGRGFETLPAPDDGDVFLDFEGHPFWRADRGLFFLFGLIERHDSGEWVYRDWRADDEAGEGRAAAALVTWLAERRTQHPGMHIYHYNHTERSSLEALTAEYGVAEMALAELVNTGAFVDLYLVARNAVQVGTESYGLKHLERLTDYRRGHEIDQGAGAVLEYERFMETGDEAAIEAIRAYNEDDVRATRALRDWLVDQRPSDLDWRAAELVPAEEAVVDEQIAALHAFAPGTVEHDLGDLLGYWRREWSAHLAPILVRCSADLADLLEDPEAAGGLVFVGIVPRLTPTGRAAKNPALRLTVPEQDLSRLAAGDSVLFLTPEGAPGFAEVAAFGDGTLDLVWSEANQELGWHPSVVVRNGWVSPRPKPTVLADLAASVLDPGRTPHPVAMALLRRDLPTFSSGGGVFTDDLEDMQRWVLSLENDCVAVQGPPGTGKTYSGARLIRSLLKAGRRVGISATSHEAIDNLLRGVADHYAEQNDLASLSAVKRGPRDPGIPGVWHSLDNKKAAKGYDLIAGTSWFFASKDVREAPVDVLVIDEAGQMSLADALVASGAARSVLLLGDPQQLPQVAQASHPGVSGLSVLQHLIGDHPTLEPTRGVFLSQTRRMHPHICSFISEQMYDGRLTSHESCALQSTSFGTGLRWIPALHADRVTECEEEAAIVQAEITRLLGTSWTDQHGVTRELTASDVMVVAPYNDQVNLIRSQLTSGVAVGTVDKFQGQEAAVVFFTMTTSTPADMPRGTDFLFSSHRFNVAISRARCLAYLVCTQELLDARGRTVEDMRLISKLCAFAEAAQVVAASV